MSSYRMDHRVLSVGKAGHQPVRAEEQIVCLGCGEIWPCAEIKILARTKSHDSGSVYDPILKAKYMPSAGKYFQRPKAEAYKYMRAVIRVRQNVEADFLDEVEEDYDWDEELMYRWLPPVKVKSAVDQTLMIKLWRARNE